MKQHETGGFRAPCPPSESESLREALREAIPVSPEFGEHGQQAEPSSGPASPGCTLQRLMGSVARMLPLGASQ